MSKLLFEKHKHILTNAYCWMPYEKMPNMSGLSSVIDKEYIKKLINKQNNSMTIKNTGLLSHNAKMYCNASKYTSSNIMILEKFLANENNDRIFLVFGSDFNNGSWKKMAIESKNKFQEINKACNILKDVFMIID